MKPRAFLFVLAATASVAACGGTPSGDWTGSVVDSAGVAIVMNPDQGLWPKGREWKATEELRIGVVEGDPVYQFGQVLGIDADEEGRIYVLDQQAQEVRVFGADGAYLHTIGRAGSGPGEIGPGAMALLFGRGDTLLVVEGGLMRVSRFLADGTAVGSFPIPFTDGIPLRWDRLPDGRIVQQARTIRLPGQSEEPEQNRLLIREGDGAIVDTLFELPLGESMDFSGGMPRFRIFETEPIWTLLDDGRLVTALSTDYRLELRTPDGRLERVVTKPFTRRPVTEADREAFLAFFEETLRNSGAPPGAWQMMQQNISFADTYTAFANLMAGPGGTILVQHVQSADQISAGGTVDVQDLGAPNWDVFNAEGRYLGVLAFPARFNLIKIRGDHAYGVWRDDMDVQYVMRFRIDRAGGADNGPAPRASPTPLGSET